MLATKAYGLLARLPPIVRFCCGLSARTAATIIRTAGSRVLCNQDVPMSTRRGLIPTLQRDLGS